MSSRLSWLFVLLYRSDCTLEQVGLKSETWEVLETLIMNDEDALAALEVLNRSGDKIDTEGCPEYTPLSSDFSSQGIYTLNLIYNFVFFPGSFVLRLSLRHFKSISLEDQKYIMKHSWKILINGRRC